MSNKGIAFFYIMLDKNQNKVAVAFALLCIVWGTTYLGIRVALDEKIPPFLLSGIRHIIAGAIFMVYCLAKGHKIPSKEILFKLCFIGILMIIGGNALVCWAEQFIPSGLTAVICSLSPMFITLMSLFAFKNFTINTQIIIGLLLGLCGVICIFYESISLQFTDNTIMGMAFLIVANLSWGLGSIFMKKNQLAVNIFMSLGIQMLFAGCLNCLISLGFEDVSVIRNISTKGWYAVSYLIIMGSLVGYGSYAYVLSFYSPSRVSIHTYVNTVIAVFVGWLIGGERMDKFVFLGTFLVLIGVLLVNQAYAKMSSLQK
jgi:drug/metabolite transporter (DMT)-like permease